MTGHWVDGTWIMRCAVLEFKRFFTPHTGEAAAAFLLDAIEEWGMGARVSSTKMENSNDMVKGVKILRGMLI